METISPLSNFRPKDVQATMTPQESFQSNIGDADYAIHALSNPDDGTYRKNLARYLDTKGLDLTANKNNELYIADRNSLEVAPVTRSFVGELVGSAPEIAGAILGSRAGVIGAGAGSVVGDGVQQAINSNFFGEELEPKDKAWELGKSAALGSGGELAGNLIGRLISPLRNLDKSAQNANTKLANEYDVELTPATATGHKGMQWFEETMAKGSLGGQSIAKAKETEIQGVENVARKLLEGKMGATDDIHNSGASLAYNVSKQKDLGEAYFNQEYGKLMEAAGDVPIPMTKLQGTAKEILDLSEKIPAFKNGIDNLAERILESPDALSYTDYGKLRTFIGAKIKDASVTGQSGSKEAYKNLYKAINKDFDNIFAGTPLAKRKSDLDKQFRLDFKKPFEDSFTRGVTGTSRNQIDPERIGGLIANSSGQAKTAANTADSGFAKLFSTKDGTAKHVFDEDKLPKKSMSSAADYLLGKSVAQDGGMSLPKMRTNLKKATGVDKLFGINKKANDTAINRIMGNTKVPLANREAQVAGIDQTNLKAMKDDIVKLIELSGQNNKVANHSGTAWMNEMLRMKNDPMRAIVGFVTDLGMGTTYNRKIFQKWLTNDLISKPQYQQLINATVQTGERSIKE